MAMSDIIAQLNQAKDLALSNREAYPEVLRQTFKLVNNTTVVQKWLANFFRLSFTSDESKLKRSARVDLAIDALDALLVLCEIPDVDIFNDVVETFVVVYRLVFRYVSENDGCVDIWNKLTSLKSSLVTKYSTSFPLPPDDEEHDLFRGINTKLQLLNLIIVIIDYQSKSSSSSSSSFSLNKVPLNHSLISHQTMEAEAFAFFDIVLRIFQVDILVTPLITATLNHLAVIARRKPKLMIKLLQVLENFDTKKKLQSNYESLEEFKLSKKYVDRALRIFINFSLRNQLIPPNLQSIFGKKLQGLIQNGDEIRKRNILLPQPEDAQIKKRKFEGFVNSSRKLTTTDYKNLYCLTDPTEELNNFDLSKLPQHILVAMTIGALNKVSVEKLSKALGIVSDRYKHTVTTVTVTPDPDTGDNQTSNGIKEKNEFEDEDDEGQSYNPASVFTLPPPKELSFSEKKEHISIIIKNFFKLAEKPVSEVEEDSVFNGTKDNIIDSQLTKIAINTWKKDSWVVLLTRLATRGMRSVDSEKKVGDLEDSTSDIARNKELGDMIRKAIFDYFLANIHGRIDIIIEWLNEEWYSEKVFNEERLINELTEKYIEENEGAKDSNDIKEKISEEIDTAGIPTPNYNLWAGKVLDAMIPFLEPNDRKIFIRLLSDLPFLNADLVSRIKSLCFDPGRSKIGFLSLQFLIMYRPPVKQACLDILRELSMSDQEDLQEESKKLLEKYK